MGDICVARYRMMKKQPLHFARNRQMLAVFWIVGLICGIFLFLYAGTPVVSLMRRILCSSVSIVSLFGIGLIPFLFTAYAVIFSGQWLIFAICFCKACLLGFVSAGIWFTFASAGWLLWSLLLFSGSVLSADLYFLWLRVLSADRICWFSAVSVAFLAVGIAERIISPFLACLIEL